MIDSVNIRKLRYRLNRQGMLELDAWLVQLDLALLEGDEMVVLEVEKLVLMDTPELLALMHGESPLHDLLKPWLK
ncbi:MAG: succinate dehydrogenase assembly factor 2 [Mariprofundaceae bacterium]